MKKVLIFITVIFFLISSTTSAAANKIDIEQIKKRKVIVKKNIKQKIQKTINFYSNTENIENCKIKDMTVNKDVQLVSSGFERFTFQRFKNPNNISLLVLPVSFKDLKFNNLNLLNLEDQMKIVKRFFNFNSYEKSNLNYTIAAKELWVDLPENMQYYGLSPNGKKISQDSLVQTILSNTKIELNLSSYDVVAIQTNANTNFYFAGGLIKIKDQEFVSPSGKVHSVILDGGQTSGKWQLIAHELGHAWLGFEDLYNHFNFSNPMKNWDFMASAYNAEVIGWHRWSAGWIEDKNVLCLLKNSNSFINLFSLNLKNENKLIAIKISDGKSIFIEYKTQSDYYFGKNTVIVYLVDTSIWHGHGPYSLIKELSENDTSAIFDGLNISVSDFTNNNVYVKIN